MDWRIFNFRHVVRILIVALYVSTLPLRAFAQSQPERDAQIAPTWSGERAAELDQLFIALKAAPDEDAAERISNKIYRRLQQSDSDTLDLMIGRAREAIDKGDMPVAIEIISRVIALQPDWAEAWNLRATVFFIMGDYDRSKSDIIETLAREPRHMGALTGLALIFELNSKPKEALAIYRRVLAFAPQLKSVKSSVERLSKAVEQPM